MRRVRKKNILDRIDDSINDKIDEIKAKRKEKNNHNNNKKKKPDNRHEHPSSKNKANINNNKKVNSKTVINKNTYKKNVPNKKTNVKEDKQKKKRRSLWKKIVTVILIIGIVGILSVSAFLGYVVITAPEFNESALVSKDQTVIYDINGNIIAKLGTEKRESITYDELPQVLIDAIIATEDSRFFQHNGVDLFRFMKAMVLQLLGQDDAGGASTLTMQTVKNNFTKKDSVENSSSITGKIKRVVRKFQDVYLAVFKLEKEYSKEEIIEMYVNDNGLGSSYYGVEEASKYYFGKSASELTLPEAAIIAGLFQAPGRHNPYKNIESATKRRTTVLTLMERHGYITKEEKELAEKIPIESLLVGANNSSNPYQGYIDTVIEEVERMTDRGDGTGGDDPATVPMKIYTTMEKGIQDGVNSVLNNNKAGYWRDDKVTAGVAIVNVETGAIAAIGGGRNKEGERLFNNATQAHRQPGSTAKPLFDYGPGIEYNNFSSYQLFNDEPWGYTNGPSIGNWDGKYMGLITMRRALQISRNIPALKAYQQVGSKNIQKFVSSIGLNVSLNSSSDNYEVFKNGLDNTINEAYAIGGAAEGYTPLEMASAYSAFASGGYYTTPHCVTKIVYRETGEEREFKYTKERVMKDSTAYIMNNVLESAVTSGFNGGAYISGSHNAAKTGTSNYDEATMKRNKLPSYAVNDLWTVAYNSKYSVGVWYGYESLSDGYNTEGRWKDSLVNSIMKYVPKDPVGWKQPSSVVTVTVEKDTWPAMLPCETTPADMRITEIFVRGTQPTEVSPRYQRLSDVTNMRTTKDNNTSVTISWDYTTPKVLTDSYLNSYFNNSVYGNQKQNYLQARKKYNEETLGGQGFGIYKQNEDGTLTQIDYTTEQTYTYNGFGATTLVIKAQYKNNNFSALTSPGQTISTVLEELNTSKLSMTLNGRANQQTNVGTYEEEGVKSVNYGTADVTTSTTIKYSVTVEGEVNEFTTPSDLQTFINTLTAGTYTIEYNANYLGATISKNRQLTLR